MILVRTKWNQCNQKFLTTNFGDKCDKHTLICLNFSIDILYPVHTLFILCSAGPSGFGYVVCPTLRPLDIVRDTSSDLPSESLRTVPRTVRLWVRLQRRWSKGRAKAKWFIAEIKNCKCTGCIVEYEVKYHVIRPGFTFHY
jgi:hypothetical protein